MLQQSDNEKIILTVSKLLPEMLSSSFKKFKPTSSNPHSGSLFHSHKDHFGDSFLRSRRGLQNSQVTLGGTKPNIGSPEIHGLCVDMGCGGGCITDYTQQTTLHGLRYVGDGKLHPLERFFWSIAFVLGILCAAYYISALYERWTDSPMIVSISPTPVLLESIPFPAITICNMNDARKTVASDIMNNSATDFNSRLEKQMLADSCDIKADPSKPRLEASWTTVQNFLIKISQPCHDMLVACRWGSMPLPCNDLFNPDLTDEGMCCSFNKVKRTFIFRNPRDSISGMNYTFPFNGIDWTPEGGYPTGTSVDTNPWRPLGPGRSKGLTVVLDAQVYEYYCSSTASVGFKTMMHNPVESPRISDLSSFLTPGMETRVEIWPKVTKSTPSLSNIPLTKRLCLFSHERELRFYRTYTQRNCQLECQSNFTLEECDCVPFYLPKDQDTRICGTTDDACVDLAKATMEEIQLSKLVNTSDEKPEDLQCSCLPSCVTIEYTKQISSGLLDESFAVRKNYVRNRDPAYFKKNMAVVHFFFVESTFTSFEKGEIFGFTEFLSSTGGLLGLFLGFSIMSAAEILYYLSLRFFCTWRRNNKKASKVDTKHPIGTIPFVQ